MSGSSFKSLLGLNEISTDSLSIANLDLTNTNIVGLNTDRVPEDADPVNLYFTDGRFDTRLATKSTTDIKEGTNLYYTDGRFDTRLATKSTTNLAEGTNLYYTNARFDTQLATKSTTNLAEGTNLYYTTARANTDFDTRIATKSIDALSDVVITAPIAMNSYLTYNSINWVNKTFPINVDEFGNINMGGYLNITGVNLLNTILVSSIITTATFDDAFDTRLSAKTTNNLAEGTNLYYTNARFDAQLATKSTSNLAEGTNLYYTTARANTDFDTRLATKSTTNLAEGTNLYYTTARANTDFDTRLATKSTTNLAEGTNLYYTNARFDTQLATKSTTNSAEGTNLYYTTARANTDFDTRLATKSTTNLAEGTNLYYTTARANTDFDTRLGTKSTTNLAEGTNLYYTNARFDTQLATKSTTNLAEGTNLYYTTARDNSNFDTRLATKSTTNLAEGTNLYYTTARANTDFDTRLGTKSTTNLAEGTNLYYTTARANTDFDTRLGTKSIDALSDVIITTPANGQLLTYNGSNWVNSTGSSAFLALSGGTMTGDVKYGASAFTLYTAPQTMTTNSAPSPFVASASDEYNPAYYAFNSNQNDYWSTAIYYNDTTGVYTRTPATTNTWGGVSYTGEYIKIDLGATYRIKTYYVRSSSVNYIETTPSIWYVGVSTDNATYTLWDSRSGEAWASQTTKTYTPASNATARYIIFVVNKTGSGGTNLRSQPRIASLYFDYETFNYDITLIRNITGYTLTTSGAITASGLITASAGVSTTTLSASGSITANAGIDLKSQSITNLATPSASTDGANKTYVDTLDCQNVKLTGDQTIAGTKEFSGKLATSLGIPCIVGRNSKGTSATGGLELYGTSANLNGPHIQAFVHNSVYPIFQQLNWSSDNVNLVFDAYFDGTNWKSSNSGSNFLIQKGGKLAFYYNSGTTVGNNISWTEAMNISTGGDVNVITATSGFLTLRKRPSNTTNPQIFMKAGDASGYAIVMNTGGLLHAWSTSLSNSEPNTGYVYMYAGANVWSSSSNRRLKSDIQTLDCGDCCEKLTKINCCSYYWKTDEKKEKKAHGFIADEVKKIFPEFVSESGIKADDGESNLEGITYTDFIPVLVSAFQHMAEKVVNLEKENKTLLNILQDQVNQLAEIRAVVFPPNAP